jgi:4-hydroxy-tetrahydrodipicolinate synthase
VPGVKALLAHIHDDPAWVQMMPPLAALTTAERAAVVSGYDQARVRRVA